MSLSEQLRAAIANSGKTHYRLAKDSGVAPHVIDRFVSGERSLNLATADKLAAVLGLALTESAKTVGSH
jgi:plasmid maintenance system antidote protein VapI